MPDPIPLPIAPPPGVVITETAANAGGGGVHQNIPPLGISNMIIKT
jgi:hypothetical protein